MMKRKRTRKDLARLYGMAPVPDEIYDMIMRADNGIATSREMVILEDYVDLKTDEIRRAKKELGYDKKAGRMGHGRLAMSPAVSLDRIVKQIKEEDDYDER